MKSVSALVMVCLLFSSIMVAQNYNPSNITTDRLFIEQISYNTRTGSLVEGNILLRQIGERNLSDVFIKSNKSRIDIFQKGNDNEVELKIIADEITENITQIGDNNSYQNINFLRGSLSKEMEIYQRGFDQKIIINGSNGLSDKMKIKQMGNSKELIINNYN